MRELVVAIIQARMGSTRLPGKVLLDIAGKPMLLRVVERVRAAACVDEVVVATSVNPCDDPVQSLCAALGIKCFRGSERDVLDRYYRSAEWIGADVVARITADCPLVDPAVIDLVISAYLKGGVDYASNRRYRDDVVSNIYPDGLDAEVFSFAALERAWLEARLASEREHVTPYIWKNPRAFRTLSVGDEADLSGLRWTVDEGADLEFVRLVYQRLGDRLFGMREVLALLAAAPELGTINSHIVINAGYAQSVERDSVMVRVIRPLPAGPVGAVRTDR